MTSPALGMTKNEMNANWEGMSWNSGMNKVILINDNGEGETSLYFTNQTESNAELRQNTHLYSLSLENVGHKLSRFKMRKEN